MKKLILLPIFCFFYSISFAQEGANKDKSETKTEEIEKIGVFKYVQPGLTVSYFHNFQGENVYILQPNARVVHKVENQTGAALSVVILFPFDKSNKFNFVLNLAVADAKNENLSFFNSQTPFGVGFAFFPIKGAKWFGINSMVNFGRQKKMRQDAIDMQFFPIASYPNYDLKVGAPVPEGVLDPFMYKETTISVNGGLVIRF